MKQTKLSESWGKHWAVLLNPSEEQHPKKQQSTAYSAALDVRLLCDHTGIHSATFTVPLARAELC